MQISILTLVFAAMASSACAQVQTIPDDLIGAWDVSAAACDTEGTSVTRVRISPNRIDTFGGHAVIAEVDRDGPVTYVAADFLQTEGVAGVGDPVRTFFRLTQRDGRDRLNLIWKDVEAVDLVRCDEGGVDDVDPVEPPAGHNLDPLPVLRGLWVRAGTGCSDPPPDAWRVHDGDGLRDARSRSCTIDMVVNGGEVYVFDQTCTAAEDGRAARLRHILVMEGDERFNLIEQGEVTVERFGWCGPRLEP